MKKIYLLIAGCLLTTAITSFAVAREYHYDKRIKFKNLQKYRHNQKTYYQKDGYYYSPADGDTAVIVNPPYGMIVPTVPLGYHTYEVNGQTYRIYNNISYVENANGGYTIVETPPEAPKMYQKQGLENSDPANQKYNEYQFKDPNDLSVKIPNGDGTFTLVPITKTADGYQGPKGEKYENFPSIDTLKKRYNPTQTQTTNTTK